MTLRWVRQKDEAYWGYSGDLIAAIVVRLEVGPNAGFWAWRVEVNAKFICENYGNRVSLAHARRAAEEAWQTWLNHAGLRPAADDC